MRITVNIYQCNLTEYINLFSEYSLLENNIVQYNQTGRKIKQYIKYDPKSFVIAVRNWLYENWGKVSPNYHSDGTYRLYNGIPVA